MALDNLQIDYLIDPAFQIENLAGKPAVGGHIEVFEAGTDTKVITYQDFDGNVNPFKIPLHSDGRAVILADPSRKYDFYVYDSFNNLMFSRLNVTPNLSGNISIKGCDVYIYNTDGTLDITQQSIQNNIRRYEINTKHKSLGVEAPLYFVEDSDTATIIGFSGDDYATKDYVDSAVSSKLDISSYSSQSGDFLTDKFEYDDDNHITAYNHSAFAAGAGSGTIYEAGDHIDITNNVISVTGLPDSADVENAISSAVTNVENKFEYNENNYITAYNNSAFAGTNYSAGDYVSIENDTISVTGLQPSGDYATHDDLSAYQPSGDYATKEDVESATSGKQDTLSAGDGITIVNNVISVTSQGGGIEQVNHDDTLSGNGNTEPLGLANPQDYVHQDDLSAYQPSGDYVYRNEMTAYQEAGDYYSASNPSGFLTTADIDNKMDTSAMTAYATTSLVSSISSELYSAVSGISGDYELVGGYGILLTDDDVNKTTTITVTATGQGGGVNSAYVTAAIESATSALVTAISGSYTLVAGTNTELIDNSAAKTTTVNVTGVQAAGNYYSASNPSGFITGVPNTYLQNSDLTIVDNKVTEISGVPLSAGDELPEEVTAAASVVTANSATWNDVTAKQPAGNYYSASNPSGFITGVDLTPYQTTAGMTAYQEVGNYMSASESTAFYPSTANPSGYLTAHQSLAGYLQNTDLGITDNKVTAISGVALSAGNELSAGSHIDITDNTVSVTGTEDFEMKSLVAGDNITISASGDDIIISAAGCTEYSAGANIDITDSVISGKDWSEEILAATTGLQPSGNYYSASNPSGFITGVDLTPYQTTAAMTGYLTTADSANFYTNDNPSGFITGVDLSDYATTADLANKQDAGNYLSASESANYYPMTGNPSGFLTEHQSLAGYLQDSDLTIVDNKITEISGVSISAGGGANYSAGDNIDITNDTISVTGTEDLTLMPIVAGNGISIVVSGGAIVVSLA